MSLSRTIRYKAPKRAGGPSAEGQALDGSGNWAKFSRAQLRTLLLLTVFAANFFVVCHCSARAAEHPSCCSKKEQKAPCKDGNECGGMHAVKFNLLEKQAARKVSFAAQLPVVLDNFQWSVLTIEIRETYVSTDIYTYTHPPPDYQSLYQCFLI